jgi:hypothetical protein
MSNYMLRYDDVGGSGHIDTVTFSLKNSVVIVRKRTMPTERPPLVGKVSANFCG